MQRTSDQLSPSAPSFSLARGAARDPASMGKGQASLPSSQRLTYRQVMLLCWCLLVTRRCATASWVDPDTPSTSFHTVSKSSTDSREFHLVFSDEFEQSGRTFHDGKDPRWTAIDKNDYTNAALHYYSNENAETSNGVLNISTYPRINSYRAFNETKKQYYIDKKYVQSAMLQSWNKFCFTGGIVEFSAKLPGSPEKGGLWPALWMLGNLARATYVGSSDFVWPYSFNECETRNRKSQLINACSKVNHFGLDPFRGRGSPEIDIIESMQGEKGKLPNTFIQRPYQSASLQIAPGVELDRPELGHRPHEGHWYSNLTYNDKNMSDLNPFFYGVTLFHKPKEKTYQSDAISANFQLNKTHYDKQHIYRVEWEPPLANGTGGYVKWYTDDEFVFDIHGANLKIMQTEIPSEPMYLLMNTAVSKTWGFPAPCPNNCDCKCYECGNPACACALPPGYCDNFPASLEIDFVRVYQAVNDPKHILGCSPESRPTEQFIKGHASKFMTSEDKRPLEPIQKGGGECRRSSDCGKGGTCTAAGICVCSASRTGPHCLAHAGFYDLSLNQGEEENFSLSTMMLPKSLLVVLMLLIVIFFFSMLQTIRDNKKKPLYRRLGDAAIQSPKRSGGGSVNSQSISPISSYQDSAAVHYALPQQQKKDVTYCVVDGRLVDDR